MVNATFVCPDCFHDYAVRAFIRRQALSAQCDYCGTISESGDLAAPLSGVVPLIREGFESDWAKLDEGSTQALKWEKRGLLINSYQLMIESTLGIESEELFESVYAGLWRFQWCARESYGRAKDGTPYYDWQTFSRYVLLAHDVLKATPEEREEASRSEKHPLDILDSVGSTVTNLGLVRTIPAGTLIVYAIARKGRKMPTTLDRFGPPSQGTAPGTRLGRAGVPVFYAATDEATALAETAASPFHTTAVFETLLPVKILDLSLLPDIPSAFDADNRDLRRNLIFLTDFCSYLYSGDQREEHEFENLPTQIVGEYFRTIFRDREGDSIRGLLWPSSSKASSGKAYGLFAGRHNCTDENHLQSNAVDVWLRMLKSSVRTYR